jgi:hypothetical protein
LIGTSLADTIDALGGNDVITGAGGNDTLDGGAGMDTAIFSVNRDNYQITFMDRQGMLGACLVGHSRRNRQISPSCVAPSTSAQASDLRMKSRKAFQQSERRI